MCGSWVGECVVRGWVELIVEHRIFCTAYKCKTDLL